MYIKTFRSITCIQCGSVFSHSDGRARYCTTKCKHNYNSKKYNQRHNSTLKLHLTNLLRSHNRRATLSVAFLEELYQKQNGICALSGTQMTHLTGQGKVHTNISIDRINCNIGYEKENVRLVCAIVNTMRNTLSDEELILWCGKIYCG